jgi:hypothetical protein
MLPNPVTLLSDVNAPLLSSLAMLVAPYLKYRTPPLSTMEKLAAMRFAAFVAFVAFVAEVADVAEVAVAALPEILIPQVPDAPVPSALGAPTVL